MILSFTAFDKHAELRNFCCQLTELEVALDVLSTVSLQGDTILTAQIIDEGSRLELPCEAFDGESFAEPIHRLEKQWKAALKKPVRSALPNINLLIELMRHQIKIYDDRIALFKLTISQFEKIRQRAEGITHSGPQRTKLVRHYDSTLNTYYQYIDQVRAAQKLAMKKLNQLQGAASRRH